MDYKEYSLRREMSRRSQAIKAVNIGTRANESFKVLILGTGVLFHP
jgi:hypothetical protein